MSDYSNREVYVDLKNDLKIKQLEVLKDKKKRNKLIRTIFLIFLVAILIFVTGFMLTYYPADESVYEILQSSDSGVTILEEEDAKIAFIPEEPIAGLIFYPGAKVEYESYVPLMKKLADKGILCVLIKMPVNYAFFGKNFADGVLEDYPQVSSWYMSGHSLGGAVASMYVNDHLKDFDGLILFGGYTISDLSDANSRKYPDSIVLNTNTDDDSVIMNSYKNDQGKRFLVMTIYGTQDGVLNRKNFVRERRKLPEGSPEIVIDGGNHAYFGNYGKQLGDGHPTITREEQMDWAVENIIEFVSRRY